MRRIRNLIKHELLRHDIVLSRPPGQFNLTDFKLANVRDRGLKVNMAIDGGAAEGKWAEELKTIYPDARILCIEPRDDAQSALHRQASQMPGMTITQTLLGATEGTTDFYESGHQSSALPDANGKEWGKKITVPVSTLDGLIQKHKLPWPDLIKLDLQGFELECLKGASACLSHAEAVLLEVSFIEIQKGMPLIGDIVPFMGQRGFRVYDITALWHRPLDGALAQGDFLFVASGSPLFADTRWSQ